MDRISACVCLFAGAVGVWAACASVRVGVDTIVGGDPILGAAGLGFGVMLLPVMMPIPLPAPLATLVMESDGSASGRELAVLTQGMIVVTQWFARCVPILPVYMLLSAGVDALKDDKPERAVALLQVAVLIVPLIVIALHLVFCLPLCCTRRPPPEWSPVPKNINAV